MQTFWWQAYQKTLDPKLIPAKQDFAAESLKDIFSARHYKKGQEVQVVLPSVGLFGAPENQQGLEDQLLYGEMFTVYKKEEKWLWGQSQTDGYVGYIEVDKVSFEKQWEPNARISVPRALVYKNPDLKTYPFQTLPLNAKIEIGRREGIFVEVKKLGWVPFYHTDPLMFQNSDYVRQAKNLIGAPYFWGGKDHQGYDCSGLVQMILEAVGIPVLRDSRQQRTMIGYEVDFQDCFSNLKYGDFVFWKGHVGLMIEQNNFLHANAHHMAVAVEPFSEAEKRIRPILGRVLAVRRPGKE